MHDLFSILNKKHYRGDRKAGTSLPLAILSRALASKRPFRITALPAILLNQRLNGTSICRAFQTNRNHLEDWFFPGRGILCWMTLLLWFLVIGLYFSSFHVRSCLSKHLKMDWLQSKLMAFSRRSIRAFAKSKALH